MPQEENKGRINLYHYLLLFSIILGAFLRFYNIGGQSLWLDESFSNYFSSIKIHELWTILPKTETNPPLYYTILKIWKFFFGTTEAGLRSLSAVMSIACIPLIFMMGKFMGKSVEGEKVGTIAALFFAVFPVHIQFAQEARSYAMLTFATTLTLCSFLWIIRHPVEACEPIIKKSDHIRKNSPNETVNSVLLPWIIMVIAMAFTLWLHNTSILYIVTLYLIILAWFCFELRFNRVFFLNMAASSVISFLLWAPYLIFLIYQTKNSNLPIPEPTINSIFITVSWLLLGTSISLATVLYMLKKVAWLLLGHSVPGTTVLYKLKTVAWFLHGQSNEFLQIGVFIVLIALAIAGLLNIRKRSGKYVFLLILGSIVGPILMELLFSFMYRPIFLGRTLIYISVPFFIAVAAGIMMLRKSGIRVFATIIILLVFLKWTHTYFVSNEKEQREPWDKIAHNISEQSNGGVALLLPNNLELPFSYYTNRINNNNLKLIPLPFPTANFLHPSPELASLGADVLKALQIRTADIPNLKATITNNSPVWLITRREDLFDHDRIVYNLLINHKSLVFKRDYGDISVFKFD